MRPFRYPARSGSIYQTLLPHTLLPNTSNRAIIVVMCAKLNISNPLFFSNSYRYRTFLTSSRKGKWCAIVPCDSQKLHDVHKLIFLKSLWLFCAQRRLLFEGWLSRKT